MSDAFHTHNISNNINNTHTRARARTHRLEAVEKAVVVDEEVRDSVHDLVHLDGLFPKHLEDHEELAMHAGLPIEYNLHIANVLRRANGRGLRAQPTRGERTAKVRLRLELARRRQPCERPPPLRARLRVLLPAVRILAIRAARHAIALIDG